MAMGELQGLISAMADAFADEEQKGGEVYSIVVGRPVLRAIKQDPGWTPSSRTFWGAEVKLDVRFKKRVVLRYRRSESGKNVPAPSPADKMRRFRKTVLLGAVPATVSTP